MEIFAFLNLTRARVATVVLAAIVGSALGGLAMRTGLASYETTVDVRVNDVFAPGRPTYDSSSYAPSFMTTLGERATADAVAKETKGDAGAIHDGLISTQTDSGQPVVVTYTASTAAESKSVALAAANVALVRSADLNRDRLAVRQTTARSAFDKASGAFNEFIVRTGFNYDLPDQLTALRNVDLPKILKSGDSAAIADAQDRLNRMQAALPEYAPLARELDAANSQLSESAQALTDANDAAAVARKPQGLVTLGDTTYKSGTSKMIRGLIGGALLGALVALVVFVLSDSRRSVMLTFPEELEPGAERGDEPVPTPSTKSEWGRTLGVRDEPPSWKAPEPPGTAPPMDEQVLVGLKPGGSDEPKASRGRAARRR